MITLEDFFSHLQHSNLLTPLAYATVRGELARVGPQLNSSYAAQWLVDQKHLTGWQAAQLLLGHTAFFLGNYKLLEKIGAGGMGEVFKAEHAVMGRLVALKVLSKTKLDSPVAVARFRREVKAAAALDHPNIITAHDAGQIGDTHFLVMEYAQGRDLNAWIKEYGRLPISWAVEFIRQAALALEHAHRQGMVHRDIKPANLVVLWDSKDEPPVVKLLDMGLARYTQEMVEELEEPQEEGKINDSTDGHLTQAGQILGTPDFLSPEQIEHTSHVDIRSDIFSLGCTLFKLITGQLPFGGSTVVEKLQERVNPLASPTPLHDVRPEAPERLGNVLQWMMARYPNDRYQTPGEVATALEEVLQETSSSEPLPWSRTEAQADHDGDTIGDDGGLKLAPLLSSPSVQDTFTSDEDSKTRNFLSQLAHQQGGDPSGNTAVIYLSLLPPTVGGSGVSGGSGFGSMAVMDPPRLQSEPHASPSHLSPSSTPPLDPIAEKARRRREARARRRRRRRMQQSMMVAGVATLVVGVIFLTSLNSWWRNRQDGPMREVQASLTPPSFPTISNPPGSLPTTPISRPPVKPPNTTPFTPPNTTPVKSSNTSDVARPLQFFKGHTKDVLSVCFVPKGNRLVTGSMDGKVQIWDSTTSTPVRQFPTLGDWVNCVAVSPDGLWLAAGTKHREVHVWRLDRDDPPAYKIQLLGAVSALHFSPDSKVLYSGDVSGLTLWVNLSSGRKEQYQLPNEVVLTFDSTPIGALAVLWNAREYYVHIVDVTRRTVLVQYELLDKTVTCATLSISSKQLALGLSTGSVEIIEMTNNTLKNRYGGHTSWVKGVAFSPDGRLLASVGADRKVQINLIGEFDSQSFVGGTESLQCLAFSPDSRTIACGGSDNLARIYQVPIFDP